MRALRAAMLRLLDSWKIDAALAGVCGFDAYDSFRLGGWVWGIALALAALYWTWTAQRAWEKD